ncbi:hypothetical protein HZA99_03785 [Candidatus Woesearchaeota archaeon]|nr:hypothetical protein [Candidatus Woesearchaeota archaeon]
MMKRGSIFSIFVLALFFLALPLFSARDSSSAQSIKILFPQNDATYGPWSDTYFDYPRTGGKAHHIRISVDIGDDVSYYRIMRNGEWVQYVGNRSMQDAMQNDSIIDFRSDDTEPLDLIGYLSALQNLTVVAYDKDNNQVGTDNVVFYLAVNLDDYYDLLSSGETVTSHYALRPDIADAVSVNQEQLQSSFPLFTLIQTMTSIQVKNKFTGEVENHTRVHLTVKPAVSSVLGTPADIYTVIPKELAAFNNLTLTGQFQVINADPVMMWHFAAVENAQDIEYDVNVPINTESVDKVVPIAITSESGVKTSWYFLIPLVIPVILLFAIVYFSRFKKK